MGSVLGYFVGVGGGGNLMETEEEEGVLPD